LTSHLTHDFGGQIADRMVAAHQVLALRWLERLHVLMPVEANEVFPTDHLLDHIPTLIVEIADYLREPTRVEFAANTLMMSKARELGELRYRQRASVHQLLREYRILGGILTAFVQEEADQFPDVAPAKAVSLLSALTQAVGVLEQATVETFIGKYSATIERQTMRMQNFNQMVSHELRQPIGALQFALKLADTTADAEDRARYRQVVERNLLLLNSMIDRLAAISRLAAPDAAHIQNLELGYIAREVARQLRDMAEARGVEIRVADGFPAITLDVAVLELILINLVSNAIKYSNPDVEHKLVEILAEDADDHCTIVVRDNGIGIAAERLPRVWEPAYRAHAQLDAALGADGYGLGLAIVRDCATDQNWKITVESVEGKGSIFRISIPHDRRNPPA
jgi:signal transduction histidine kinase